MRMKHMEEILLSFVILNARDWYKSAYRIVSEARCGRHSQAHYTFALLTPECITGYWRKMPEGPTQARRRSRRTFIAVYQNTLHIKVRKASAR